MEKDYEKYWIKCLNDIIKEAVDHGGDAGGPWFSNKKRLVKAIKEFIMINQIPCHVDEESDIPEVKSFILEDGDL